MNITHINSQKPGAVQGLSPALLPAELIAKPTHLQCGSCGFIGEVKFYYFTDEEWCYEPVCNCPIPATLFA